MLGLQATCPIGVNVFDSTAGTHRGLQFLLVCSTGLCAWPSSLPDLYVIDPPNCVAAPTTCNEFADDTAVTTVRPSPEECEGHVQRSVDATSARLSDWR